MNDVTAGPTRSVANVQVGEAAERAWCPPASSGSWEHTRCSPTLYEVRLITLRKASRCGERSLDCARDDGGRCVAQTTTGYPKSVLQVMHREVGLSLVPIGIATTFPGTPRRRRFRHYGSGPTGASCRCRGDRFRPRSHWSRSRCRRRNPLSPGPCHTAFPGRW